MSEITTIKSKIDPKYTIYLITKEDIEYYTKLKPLFDIYGLAYVDIKSKKIFCDLDKINNLDEFLNLYEY